MYKIDKYHSKRSEVEESFRAKALRLYLFIGKKYSKIKQKTIAVFVKMIY